MATESITTRRPTTSRSTRTSFAPPTVVANNKSTTAFWDEIHELRTNGFEYADEGRKWSFQSRKSHILDTKGYYAWERELNCYQLQKLPAEVFPHNTLEIQVPLQNHTDASIRIRFGALEGLRGWISLDADPIPTTHARDSAHWKFIAAQGQLPSEMALGKSRNDSILSTSYDYAFSTLYKGGTDVIHTQSETNYHYLSPNSTSFVPKHGAGENDLMVARGGLAKVRVRKPICKCKSDGGRKPLVTTSGESKILHSAQSFRPQSLPFTPQWKSEENYKVDIEGMLRQAASANPQRPFLFREDVDLWSDDLHDNGVAWLKARCFVCHQGWACLLRNFIRVDGVLCRVIDTRYIHTFGTSQIYREHSWREGPWEVLMRSIPRDPRIPSNGPINDSIAARFLPLKEKPRTECLSLNDARSSPAMHSDTKEELFVVHDATIEDTIPVPNSKIRDALGISFVLKRKNAVLEAISTMHKDTTDEGLPVSSLWSRKYSQDASILSVQISPNPADGGKIAIGDDRGTVTIWRLSTGEHLWGFPVAPQAILKRLEQNPCFESARLWVEHLAWSPDGSLVGAAAGRNTVLVSNGKILNSLESKAGTVTGLAFSNLALAVASYGEIRWLTADDDSPQTLKRQGAAIECIDVSPDGKRLAAGFLDKTLRVFNLEKGCNGSTSSPFDANLSNESSAMDWVGFNTAVKSVRFSTEGSWLAAMGGSTVLVIRYNQHARAVPPIVCRTPGRTEADGSDGSCHRFEGIEWSGEENGGVVLLAALDSQTKDIHVFQFSSKGASNVSVDSWPIQVSPILTISLPFAMPSPLVSTRFAFFTSGNISNGLSSWMLERIHGKSTLEQEFESRVTTSDSREKLHDNVKDSKNESFFFRNVLYTQ